MLVVVVIVVYDFLIGGQDTFFKIIFTHLKFHMHTYSEGDILSEAHHFKDIIFDII